ncbi:MAG TPA: VanZ family protein [Candidatus Binataceae bacterium]|nr:VanZ family protein [Candidatus Binataceae bacterium]
MNRWFYIAATAAAILIGLGILGLGTSYFSYARTAAILDPLIRRVSPGATAASLYDYEYLIRKTMHFAEYALLYLVLVLGPLRRRPLTALAICIICALLDEGGQLLRPDRSALVSDVALDISGATAVMLIGLTRWGYPPHSAEGPRIGRRAAAVPEHGLRRVR